MSEKILLAILSLIMICCIVLNINFAYSNYCDGELGKFAFSIFAGIVCVVALIFDIYTIFKIK